MNIPRASIWPNVSFDTNDPAEMAAAEEWAASLSPVLQRLRAMEPDGFHPTQVYDARYGRWCHTAEDLYRWLTRPNEPPDPRYADGITPEAAVRLGEPRTGRDSTQIPDETNRSAAAVRDGDGWTVRNNQVIVTRSNDWPAPTANPQEDA